MRGPVPVLRKIFARIFPIIFRLLRGICDCPRKRTFYHGKSRIGKDCAADKGKFVGKIIFESASISAACAACADRIGSENKLSCSDRGGAIGKQSGTWG